MLRSIAFVLALTASAAGASTAQTAKNYTPADVHFVAGMIGHDAQAIQMAGWAPPHGASPAVRVLCERIVVAQTDEIAFAQRWLREHHEFVPPADPRGHVMPGMDRPMLMPGMLTPDQMAQLDAARPGVRPPVPHVHDSAPPGRAHHGDPALERAGRGPGRPDFPLLRRRER